MGEMIMTETEIILMKQELENMQSRYDQYKKEYNDLCNKSGLYKVIHLTGVSSEKRRLQVAIVDLGKAIDALRELINKLETDKKELSEKIEKEVE